MYHGGLMQRYWAYSCQAHFVGAMGCGDPCTIINPLGELVAASTSDTPYVCAEVNLDCCLVHYDDNFKKLRAMKDKYQRHVTITDPAVSAALMLTSARGKIGHGHDLRIRDRNQGRVPKALPGSTRDRPRAIRQKTHVPGAGWSAPERRVTCGLPLRSRDLIMVEPEMSGCEHWAIIARKDAYSSLSQP